MTTTGFHIVTSNAMEILARGLAELLGIPRPNPLMPDIVLVQSKGMQKWASLAVAENNGICANIDFPFPNAFFKDLYSQIIGPLPAVDPFDPKNLGFRIMAVLPAFLGRSEFKALDLYLAENQHPLKLFQLSRKIADVFDQYSIFRPQMMLDWERGVSTKHHKQDMADRQWQVILWQELTAQVECPHRARRQNELVVKLAGSPAGMAGLPDRLMVFGISHLPPYHLRVLDALARQLPVFLFLLNPCRHYWSDIISDRQKAYIHGKMGDRLDADHWLHMETGNRLLASLGQQGREFLNAIYQIQGHLVDSFIDNNTHTLLGQIQQEILELIDLSNNDGDLQPGRDIHDNTIRIQNCHSPMREVEVLHDQLLDMMSQYSDIAPRDILVMAPDIDEYLPYIQAVFGANSESQTKVPYTVADQSILIEDPNIECFLKILGIFYERFEVSRILALLEYPMLQQTFNLNSNDLPIIERWIEMVGIRWGWDKYHRKQYGLPGFIENTWRMGLDRLLMGYAMSGENGQFMDGILPFTPIEGDQGRILGGLVLFAESLQQMLHEMNAPRTLAGWQDFLSNIIEIFFADNDNAGRHLQLLRDVVGQMGDIGHAADFTQPIGFEVIYQYLKEVFTRTAYEAGFFSGGVTFCAILPMRSIPAKVICLLGMNHDSFPREMHEPDFNLIAADPQPGDRSKRSDDRYLFLESLVSARRIFYLSYIGQDIQDNAVKPPSVVLDELSDYIQERFHIPAQRLITTHPLHAFSPQYFSRDDSRLFSYSRENHNASLALANPHPPVPFFKEPLPLMDPEARHIDLADLLAFFTHPTRYLLERRLGVEFKKNTAPLTDRELFTTNALDNYLINNQLVAMKAKNSDGENAFLILNATGRLPHGSIGRFVYEKQNAEVQSFMRVFAPFLPEGEPNSETLSVVREPFQVDGLIQGLYDQARVVLRIGKTRPRDLVQLFLTHMIMLLGANEGLPQTSRLICMDEIWEIGPIKEVADLLPTYLRYFWDGMHAPLPFFERSSHTYARLRLKNETSHQSAMVAALKKWRGDFYDTGEVQDPHNLRCFADMHELPEGFADVAQTIFAPIFRHCRSIHRD